VFEGDGNMHTPGSPSLFVIELAIPFATEENQEQGCHVRDCDI
jgi:hypothetical protein